LGKPGWRRGGARSAVGARVSNFKTQTRKRKGRHERTLRRKFGLMQLGRGKKRRRRVRKKKND